MAIVINNDQLNYLKSCYIGKKYNSENMRIYLDCEVRLAMVHAAKWELSRK